VRIVDARVIVCCPGRNFVTLKVVTEDGVHGLGDATLNGRELAVASYLEEHLVPLLIGRDARRIEDTWHYLYKGAYWRRGPVTMAAIGAVDTALWDIRGKALGLPIYQLLGGPVRESIALYTHFPLGATPQEAAKNVLVPVNDGVKAIKTDPFQPAHARRRREGISGAYAAVFLDGGMDPRGEQEGADFIAAIREAVGPDVEILIDAHALYNVPTAIRLANKLAPYNLTWFEEPVPPESYHALRQVREQVQPPICVGERLHTRWEFVPVLEQRLADYIMPDVTWTGGISELKKISTMAEAYYVPVSPHDASGPINVLAGAHVMMTVPNFYRLETARSKMSAYDVFITEPLDTRDGQLFVPQQPGLGLEMNVDYLKAHAEPGWGG
jgi:galactonate dehydratase